MKAIKVQIAKKELINKKTNNINLSVIFYQIYLNIIHILKNITYEFKQDYKNKKRNKKKDKNKKLINQNIYIIILINN